MKKSIAIRLDAGSSIGGGHAMRCIAIAKQLQVAGATVSFLVSNEESKRFLEEKGQKAEAIGGDPKMLGFSDGALLAEVCENRFNAILVDTYGVTDGFFAGLNQSDATLCLVDDMYTFEIGNTREPVRRDADIVLDYELFASEEKYGRAYSNGSIKLLIGPKYAPIREEFQGVEYSVSETVKRILVTSGSTNPDHALERMMESCSRAVPGAAFDIVVGGMASFDESVLTGFECNIHRDVKNMATLMARADLAVSAAGSTLYELSCIGVPTVAIPIVENQVENARGFSGYGLGLSLERRDWKGEDLAQLVMQLSRSFMMRSEYSQMMSECVDGKGAERVARCVLESISAS